MNRSIRFAWSFLAAVLAAHTARAGVDGASSPFSVAVLVDGHSVPEYAARGRIYVEALQGKEFVVRLTNSSSSRVAVALSVDGRNVIDARRTTASDAAKWILAPGQIVDVPGWQVSGDTARRFFFTQTSRSYARWLGDAANVGTIETVFFLERCRPQPPTERGKLRKDEPLAQDSAQAPASPESAAAEKRAANPSIASDRYAATGIGDRTSFPVRWTAFDQEPSPAARITLRYEFRSELVRLGVLPREERELFARDHARGFEHDYAPDPDR